MKLRVGALAASLCLPAAGAAGAPTRLYLKAHYLDGKGQTHQLVMWRDGDRLRRDTDEKLSLYVTHGRDDRFRVVDKGRKIAYDVRRTNLYRIGTFTDWSSLTTLVHEPANAPPLAKSGEPALTTQAGVCRWRVAPDRRYCWSSSWQLPLLVERQTTEGWKNVLTVEEVRSGKPPAGTFELPADVSLIDVDRDVDPND